MSSYTGGRIVPRHDGEWDSTKEYEQLTIVLNSSDGVSYISRKKVPAGTELSDTDYWAVCSQFSQQLKNVADQLDETDSKVETLQAQVAANVSASTDSDADYAAEVVDMRVDEQGTTHDSAGDAVRDIAERLTDDIEQLFLADLSDVTGYTETYYWSVITETNVVSGARTVSDLVRYEPIRVHPGQVYRVATSAYGIALAWFITDADYNLIRSSEDVTSTLDEDIEIETGDFYLLVNSKDPDETAIVLYNFRAIADEIESGKEEIESINEKLDTHDSSIEAIEESLTAIRNGNLAETTEITEGYYWSERNSEGIVHGNSTYESLSRYSEIKVRKGEIYCVETKGTGIAEAWYLVDENYSLLKSSNGITSSADDCIQIDDDSAKYLLVNSTDTDAAVICRISLDTLLDNMDTLSARQDTLQEEQDTLADAIEDAITETESVARAGRRIYEFPLDTAVGYIDYADGVYHKYDDGNSSYMANSEYYELHDGGALYYLGALSGAADGIAFYDADKTFISGVGGSKSIANMLIEIPEDAVYVRGGSYKTDESFFYELVEAGDEASYFEEDGEEDDEGTVVINCIGDSVTEGMSTTGAHYAVYGQSPYPARLYTLLVDNGYDNVVVNNYGHGGERTPDIAARLGAIPCYLSEDIEIDSSNTAVSLGAYSTSSGRVIGTKLKLMNSDSDDEDYCVYFTQVSHDTNPVYIDGIPYTMSVSNGADYIKLQNSDGEATTIKSGKLVFTNDNRNADVNVIYGGINDGASLTLERFIDTMKACGEVNGGKYIIIGCTHTLFTNWADVEGNSTEEKYEYYKRACYEAFGIHFLDLYEEFYDHALEYAIDSGYFGDATDDELEEMESLLDSHIIPAQFCYDKETQNNVHLSEEGYHVVAMLIFDRLKRLNYI